MRGEWACRLSVAVREARAEAVALELEATELPPRTRGECEHGPRPCPWVRCRYHLGIDVSASGGIRIPHSGDPIALRETCALDVAARGGRTLEEVGELVGLTRERVRQIESAAMDKLVAGTAHMPPDEFRMLFELLDAWREAREEEY